MHSLAPAGLNLPARQLPLQFEAAAVVAPTGPKRPGAHAVPPAHEMAPSVLEKRPDSHAVHCAAAAVALYFPRPHVVHAVAPGPLHESIIEPSRVVPRRRFVCPRRRWWFE